MKKSKYSPEQILQALRQAEGGTPVGEVRRKLGVTEGTFYRWKKQYAGLDVGELRELRALQDENAKLRRVVADLTFPPQMSRGSIGGFRSGVTPEEVLWQAKAGDGTPMSRS